MDLFCYRERRTSSGFGSVKGCDPGSCSGFISFFLIPLPRDTTFHPLSSKYSVGLPCHLFPLSAALASCDLWANYMNFELSFPTDWASVGIGLEDRLSVSKDSCPTCTLPRPRPSRLRRLWDSAHVGGHLDFWFRALSEKWASWAAESWMSDVLQSVGSFLCTWTVLIWDWCSLWNLRECKDSYKIPGDS